MIKIVNSFIKVAKVYIQILGVDTKRRITKRRNHNTATVTKQRLPQNDDCYKTAKIIQKNHPNFLIKNQRF